jgi:hypothetical protein
MFYFLKTENVSLKASAPFSPLPHMPLAEDLQWWTLKF